MGNNKLKVFEITKQINEGKSSAEILESICDYFTDNASDSIDLWNCIRKYERMRLKEQMQKCIDWMQNEKEFI